MQNRAKPGPDTRPPRQNAAYLDIETSYQGKITVVGIHFPGQGTRQLVGDEISAMSVLEVLQPAGVIKTYNGDRFDLPVIKQRLGLDVKALFPHEDIMYACWRQHLKGGLKAVERQLGLVRETEGVDGMEAMALWSKWQDHQDRRSLDLLLKYNREDVELLVIVEERLQVRQAQQGQGKF